MAIQIGDIVGDYQVTGVLGRGGMGRVFRVRNLLTEREEAMKIVLSDFDEHPALADRFLREIRIHASLHHPHIATLHAALRIGDRLVMILELVEGVSLEEKLRPGPMPVAVANRYIGDVLLALAYAHERGVIHRDIKPANVLVAGGDVVKLADFGIALSTDATRFTGTGRAVGTLAYMSPEQVRSAEVDARSDIYSLGLTFYEMVTGRRAIHGDSEHALMNAQLTMMPPDPAVVNQDVPPGISAVIMRSLSKEPGGRFQTALEFRAAVKEASETGSPSSTKAAAIPAAELGALENQLARVIGPIARRMVADAARRFGTISEIRQSLARHVEDLKVRERFLKGDPLPTLSPTVTMVASGSKGQGSIDAATFDRFVQALAPYVGPIAKVLVSRGARSMRSIEELQETLAAEIPSAEDRKRFLCAVRSIS